MKYTPPKHLILVSIDNLRQDALSSSEDRKYLVPYGLECAPATPNLDFFARKGFVFSQSRSTSSYTPPSHASMLTGLYPQNHGVRLFFHNQLSPNVRTLFDEFASRGFKTIASVDFVDLFRGLKLTSNARTYHAHDDYKETLEEIKTATRKGERVAAFFHFIDAHYPYGLLKGHSQNVRQLTRKRFRALGKKLGLPYRSDTEFFPKFRVKTAESGCASEIGLPLYLNGVNQFDRYRFARFVADLRRLGVLQDALFVITSDHGEGIIRSPGSRLEEFFHGDQVREELVRVPMIFWTPQFEKLRCRKSSIPTSIVDVLPTILGLMGAGDSIDQEFDGEDRSSTILGRQPNPRPSISYCEAVFEDRHKWSSGSKAFLTFLAQGHLNGKIPPPPYRYFLNERALYWNQYKLVLGPEGRRLYNLESDPFETRNLLSQNDLSAQLGFVESHKTTARKMTALFPRDEFASSFSKLNRTELCRDQQLIAQMTELGY